MKRIPLIVTLLLAVLLLQNCKKDTVTATAASTSILFAEINDTTWHPTAVSAAITYNSALKTKVFSCTGATDTQQVTFSISQAAGNTTGFPISTFNVDATPAVSMSYNILTNGTYQPDGIVIPGSGTVTVTAIDSVKKHITGTFSFTATRNVLLANGGISINIAEVSQGAFNGLPYTFASN